VQKVFAVERREACEKDTMPVEVARAQQDKDVQILAGGCP